MSKLNNETFASALDSLRAPDFVGGLKHQEQKWRAERQFGSREMRADGTYSVPTVAHPHVLEFTDRLIDAAAKLHIPLFSNEIIRTKERQTMLYVTGKSQLKEEGPHQIGCATDIVHGVRGWELTPMEWLLVERIGEDICYRFGLYMVWGGSWRRDPKTGVGWDPAHWELAYWREIKHLAPFPAGFDPKIGRPKRRPSAG